MCHIAATIVPHRWFDEEAVAASEVQRSARRTRVTESSLTTGGLDIDTPEPVARGVPR